MTRIPAILFCLLLAVTASAQLPPIPLMQPAVRIIQSPKAVSLNAPQSTGIQTTNVSAPQNLSVTTTAGVNVALFVRTSNEWYQVSSDLVNWLNLSQLKSSVSLGWNQSTDTNVAGYNVYYGTASGVYTNEICAGTNISLTIPSLIQNTTYYFVATCYTGAGLESQFSTEVVYTIPISTTRFKVPGQ